jgi:hypothetical protein
MSATFELSGVDQSLAQKLSNIDSEWLESELEELAEEWSESRKGSDDLLKYDFKDQIMNDDTISEEEQRRRGIKWDRQIGGRRR